MEKALDPNDFVGVSFWIISAAMVAATYFFTVERDRVSGKWKTSLSVAAMVCGMAEDPAIEYLAAGAVGFSSGMANFAPRTSLAILRRFAEGDRSGAEELREVMVPFEDLRGERAARYSGSALHAAMRRAGLAGGPVVPFAEDVDDSDIPRLNDMIDRVMAVEKSLIAQ